MGGSKPDLPGWGLDIARRMCTLAKIPILGGTPWSHRGVAGSDDERAQHLGQRTLQSGWLGRALTLRENHTVASSDSWPPVCRTKRHMGHVTWPMRGRATGPALAIPQPNRGSRVENRRRQHGSDDEGADRCSTEPAIRPAAVSGGSTPSSPGSSRAVRRRSLAEAFRLWTWRTHPGDLPLAPRRLTGDSATGRAKSLQTPSSADVEAIIMRLAPVADGSYHDSDHPNGMFTPMIFCPGPTLVCSTMRESRGHVFCRLGRHLA